MKRILKVALARTGICLAILTACLLVADSSAKAQTPEETTAALAKLTVGLDTVWVMLCGMMVFFMNLGFGCVESGFARAKNTVNILSKNFVVFAVTSIVYWFIGWGLMFGEGSPYFGKEGLLMLSGADNSPATGDAYVGAYKSIGWAGLPLGVKFFFQLVFAGTAATIVSGAVAERIKYISFIVFSGLMAVVLYPVTGHWVWGGGWLATMETPFWDFAGCAVVHSVGGWAAMTGAYVLGPRIGKYGPDGKVNAIPGHNMTSAFIGCLVLWLGWFGFNPGSTMSMADPALVAKIAINTNAAAAIATLTATATAWIVLKKPDLGMTINGCLAGLVAITAPCAWVSMNASLIIGAIAGVFVVFSVLFFDKIKCDDPVGATSVHLGCGTLGCLFIGLFAEVNDSGAAAPATGLFNGGDAKQLISQIIGIGAVGIYTVVVSTICWLLIKYTIGLRVTAEEETEGLDVGEHGHQAYHGFLMGSDAG